MILQTTSVNLHFLHQCEISTWDNVANTKLNCGLSVHYVDDLLAKKDKLESIEGNMPPAIGYSLASFVYIVLSIASESLSSGPDNNTFTHGRYTRNEFNHVWRPNPNAHQALQSIPTFHRV